MRKLILLIGVATLGACGQSTENKSTNEATATANAGQPEKKPAYCFFKDDEMKAWKAVRVDEGNIRITGKAHVKDPRYKATIGQVAVGPKKVVVFPTIATNDTGYAKPDDWWDLESDVPNTASLSEVVVQCGDKVVADIQVPPKS